MRLRMFIFITAFVLGLLGVSSTQAASQATGLTITPATATLTADQSQIFTVKTTNADGTSTDVTSAATLSVDDPVGTITGATYQAGKVGQWQVTAAYQSLTASAPVTVTAGALAEIQINPNSDPEYTTIGTTKKFRAQGFDQRNNTVDDVTFAWSVVGDIGTISQAGLFTPTKVGTGKIQAQSGTVTGQVPVVVSAAAATNINGGTNTNTAAQTTNTNSQATNVNATTNTAVTNTTTSTPATTTNDHLQCTTLKSWLWVVLLIVYLAVVVLLYGLASATAVWPVIAALAGAALLTVIQRKYGCTLQPWWAWVMTIGTVGISLIAVRQSSRKNP